jgi:hypothetical protein
MLRHTSTILAFVAAIGLQCGAAERKWQTGTCTDVGSAPDVFASDYDRGVGRTTIKPSTPIVATYVLETSTLRLEMRELVPIGTGSLLISIGDTVTFALQKNAAYIKDRNGHEQRLRVPKKTLK